MGVAVAEWAILRAMYGATKKSASPSAIAKMVGLIRGAFRKYKKL